MEFERLKKLISDEFGINVTEIKKETDFIKDLGADSLQMLELEISICKEFDINLNSRDVRVKTVSDVYNLVMTNLV